MIGKYIGIILALGIWATLDIQAQTQSLVPDAGFEKYRGCPEYFNDFFMLQHWYRCTEGTPDVFSNCSVDLAEDKSGKKSDRKAPTSAHDLISAQVPKNDIGFQYPHTGNSYGGLTAYASINAEYAEYMCIKLSQPMVKGKRYKLSMFISLADNSFYYGSNIGALFVKDESTLPNKRPMLAYNTESIKATPDITFDLSTFTDTVNWQKVEGTFISIGGENYMVIGAFGVPAFKGRFAAKNKITGVLTARKPYTYYYIDDVEVVEDTVKTFFLEDHAYVPEVKKPVAEKPFVIPNLYFETNKWDILPKSFKSLDSVATHLKTLKGVRIEVSGHTDDVGTEEDNLKLSENRAKAVADYLISKGVNKTIISAKGYGEVVPVGTIKDRNRRVEIKLMR
jgi:OmpA-OmpF porin, OOP family